MTTYREWLGAEHRQNTSASLGEYISGLLHSEGWRSEFKAATRDVNYGVREAVCALANARGGEVFVGVTDDGSVEGTPVTEQNLNETLRQPRADRADWFETDLLSVSEVLPVSLPTVDRRAFVIEVRGPDRPAFVFENGKYRMAKRNGSDSITLDNRASIEWFKEWRRGEILRTCYLELSQYASQLSLHRPLPGGLPDRLPFITSASQEGALYRFLTEEDRTFLVGRGTPNQGRSTGAVDLYYEVVSWARTVLASRPVYNRSLPLRDLDLASAGYADLDHEVVTRLASFAQYIRSKGFAVPG